MNNLAKVLSSGANLELSMASFQESHKLFKAVMKELGSLESSLEMDKKLMVRLVSSEEIERCLWPCMARGAYDKVKINADLFEEVATAREDFLEIAMVTLEFNLRPFFKGLVSPSKDTAQAKSS